MINGIILLPIGGDAEKRIAIFKSLTKLIDIAYVGIDDIKDITGDTNLKADIIIANLKTYVSKCVPYVYFDCDNQTPEQRKVIIDLANQAKYSVVGLVLDTPHIKYTMLTDAPKWDEGFNNIYYKD